MSVLSELSLLELSAERGELLPEREALQLTLNLGNFSSITQSAANVAIGNGGDVSQSISQTASVDQSFSIG